MNIVILDGYTVNNGDLNWQPIAALGDLTIYDRSPQELVVERCQGKEVALVNKTTLSGEILRQLPDLQYIGFLATGYNTVDLGVASALGITVTNAVGYSSASVAQHAIALLLELSNQVALHAQSTRVGEWQNNPDWTYRQSPLVELAGKKMGIVGLGNIGKQTARIARALGMEILAYNRHPQPAEGVRWVSIPELFQHSDVVSLHCPLNQENAGFVNRSLLQQMKPSAFLINTARGGLINEADLAEALEKGWLAGAGLDVLSEEPPRKGNPLLSAPHCFVTPHNAWGSRESRQRLIQTVADNLSAFLAGKPQSVVNSF
jgi:glycerate dehydrogenase